MKAAVPCQCGLCSHPTADARVDAIGWSSLLLHGPLHCSR